MGAMKDEFLRVYRGEPVSKRIIRVRKEVVFGGFLPDGIKSHLNKLEDKWSNEPLHDI